MKTKLLILIILFSCSVYAQDSISPKPCIKHYVGAGAGFTTGYGLSYRLIYHKLGAQLNFGPQATRGGSSTISNGLTLLFKITELEETNLFLYWGNHAFYRREVRFDYWNGSNYYTKSLNWNSGMGLDIELNKNKRFVFNLMFGFAGYNTFETLNLTGEIAAHFRLN